MESAQISGKVFRFLSTMHPSLSKPERKRYAEFHPDKWYPWTADIAAEFTELMRRSPRDTSFARGFAYAATTGLPEDVKLSPTELVAGLSTLPAAFGGPSGSGFDVNVQSTGFADVFYSGMPGFANVCIAVAGELTKRLLDVGARGLDVKHVEGCRLQGAEACKFEVRWMADAGDSVAAPAAAAPAAMVFERPAEPPSDRAFERPEEPPVRSASVESLHFHDSPPPRSSTISARPSRPSVEAAWPSAAPTGNTAGNTTRNTAGNTAEDLFEQLRARLSDAERQSARHAELESHIASLDARATELEAALAAAEAEAATAREDLADLKRRIRDLVG